MLEGKTFFLCPYGIGDTFIVCSYKKIIEEKYNVKIVFIIKRSQEIVLKILKVEDYIIYDFSKEEVEAISHKTDIKNMREGEIFLTRPGYEDKDSVFRKFIDREISFTEMYSTALGIPYSKINTSNLTMIYPKVTEQLLKKLPAEISDITLILPEMNAPEIDTVSLDYFSKLVHETEGPIVINMLNQNDSFSKYCIDFSLEELIALAINCKKVISARSGLCDLIYPKVKDLEVIYPNHFFFDLYKFDDIFCEKNSGVVEKILGYKDVLDKLKCKSVAIYGIGFVGLRILERFKLEKINVSYVIDRRRDIDNLEVPLFHPDDLLPKIDLIIVTPEVDADRIIKNLKKKCEDTKIYFYRDILRDY